MPVDFDEFVEQRQRESNAAPSREERLAAWKGELDKLYAVMEQCLKPYSARGIKVKRHPVELVEGYLGRYTVDALSIFIGKHEVIAEPVGALVIGAKGRVDLSGPRRTLKIVLLEKGGPIQTTTVQIDGASKPQETSTRRSLRDVPQRGWYVVTSPPDATATLLDADSFKKAIMDVAGARGA